MEEKDVNVFNKSALFHKFYLWLVNGLFLIHFFRRDENTRRDYDTWLREQLLRENQGIIGQQIVIDNKVERVEEFCRWSS